jgi:hypothetical protein
MSIARPAASFALAGGGASGLGGALGIGGALSLAQAAVRRVSVELSVDEAHDRIELWLWRGSALEGAEPDAELVVGLGDGDEVEDVLTTSVHGVDVTGWGSVLTAFAPSRKLSDVHVGSSYVSQTLGAVVQDLLAAGGVDAGDVDASMSFPALHVDPRRSVWGNLHALARRTGHQVTSTPEGAVSFGPAAGSPALPGGFGSVELRAGAELVRYRSGPRPKAEAVGAVTPAGSSQWYLLLAEPESGSDPPVLVHPALRSRELADAAATAAGDLASRRTRSARVRVPGQPGLRAGAMVTALDEDHRVLRARHLLDAEAGYVCDLVLEGAT